MKLKAQNPYSQTEQPISWAGWENGFASPPNSIISPLEKAEFGPRYEKAFYRGQGAQIVRKSPGYQAGLEVGNIYKEENPIS